MSFYDRDHGDGSETKLGDQVAVLLEAAGIAPIGAVRLMCMPRILGYVFNPLSVYFCYRPDGALAATIYEVSNTFGQRHNYVIPVDEADDSDLRQTCAKRFYVSPFMDMDMEYKFRVSGPADRLVVGIIGSQAGGGRRGLLGQLFLDDQAAAEAGRHGGAAGHHHRRLPI